MSDDDILTKAKELIKYNQMSDQNGFQHPNKRMFETIEKAFAILEDRVKFYKNERNY